ncbi:MAG: PD-(D/E)XK nuclease family protein [Thermoplasmatales archaeon]
MADGGNKRHIFYSGRAASAFSAVSGLEAQGIKELIREISSSVKVNIITEEESLVALLKSGASVDDLLTMKSIQNFLKILGETSKVHKLVAGDSSEKKIERYSEITLSYYKLISEMGKSEAEDFCEFITLFPINHNLSANYVSHIPPFLAPYHKIFTSHYDVKKKKPKISKKRFPDYYSETRWIVRDILRREGLKIIVVPDDLFAVNVAKELEMYGVSPTVASPVPEFILNDSPYNFVISLLRAIDEDFSYETMIPLFQNPYSGIDKGKIYSIKRQCYEKNITKGINDWKTLFEELRISSGILGDLDALSREIDQEGGIRELVVLCEKYLGERNYPNKILNVLASSFEDYRNDTIGIINDLESMKYLPRVSIVGGTEVLIGGPMDFLGLEIDNLYLAGLDAASSLRSFSEESRDFVSKLGLEDAYEKMVDSAYRELLDQSESVTMTYSSTDEKLSYTESIPLYDEIQVQEEYVPRDLVFIPEKPVADWELGSGVMVKDKYTLEKSIIDARLQKPIYPTFVENYAGCHFKGFVNGLLGVDEVDPPREFLDPRTTGSMTHRILERYYSTDISPADFGKLADSYVKGEISREKFESRIEALKFYRDKYIANGKLVKFFVMDVNHALELGRKTIQKEFHFPTSDQQVFYEVGGNKIRIGGYVDRVDEEGDALCIIDYKSSLYGYPKNDLCDERHWKVQLFFYKLGVESILRKKVRAAAYVSFRDINEGFNTAGFFNAIPNEEAQLRKCREIVDPVLESFLTGDVDPVVKEGDSLWKCENELFCPLLSVCRVQERRW